MGNRSAYSGIQSSIIFYLGGLGEKTDHRKYLMRVWGYVNTSKTDDLETPLKRESFMTLGLPEHQNNQNYI